jgi:hypothetical protein
MKRALAATPIPAPSRVPKEMAASHESMTTSLWTFLTFLPGE